MIQPKVVLLIFVSGKIVLTGAKVRSEIYEAFNKIYNVLAGALPVLSVATSFSLFLLYNAQNSVKLELSAIASYIATHISLRHPHMFDATSKSSHQHYRAPRAAAGISSHQQYFTIDVRLQLSNIHQVVDVSVCRVVIVIIAFACYIRYRVASVALLDEGLAANIGIAVGMYWVTFLKSGKIFRPPLNRGSVQQRMERVQSSHGYCGRAQKEERVCMWKWGGGAQARQSRPLHAVA